MSNTIDLGPGHTFTFYRESADGEEAEPAGGIHEHPRPDNGEPCSGAVAFRGRGRGGRPEWDVLSWDPLTLSPSLLCRTCGRHGWIREGRWVEA